MKKTIILCLIIILALPLIISAQRKLNVDYPDFTGNQEYLFAGKSRVAMLPSYIRYAFVFIVVVSGLIVFSSLIYGGIMFLSSRGDPSMHRNAKDQVFASIIGLIIVLSSALIVGTINPEIINLKNASVIGINDRVEPGVYLMDSQKNTAPISPGTTNLENINIRDLSELFIVGFYVIQTIPPVDENGESLGESRRIDVGDMNSFWTVILHSDKNGTGSCLVKTQEAFVRSVDLEDGEKLPLSKDIATHFSGSDLDFNAKSITVFKQDLKSEKMTQATVYKGAQYQDDSFALIAPNFKVGSSKNLSFDRLEGGLSKNVRSIRVPEGQYVLLVEGDETTSKRCQLIKNDSADLNGQYINKCLHLLNWNIFQGKVYKPCATNYITFPVK